MTIVYRWKPVAFGSQLPWSVPRKMPSSSVGSMPAAPGDAVLAVGREGHVLGLQRPAGADLRGLLAEQRHPDAQLALPLQRVGLPVEPADQHHVAVEGLQGRHVDVGDVAVEARVADPLTLRRQQLDQVGAALVGALQPGDAPARGLTGRREGVRGGWGPGLRNGHGCLLVLTGPRPFVAARAGLAPDRAARVGRGRPALATILAREAGRSARERSIERHAPVIRT